MGENGERKEQTRRLVLQYQTFLKRNGFPERCVLFRDFFSNQINSKFKIAGDILVKFL